MSKQREVRFLSKAEVRAKADGSKVITGYAAMFDSPSQDLGGFVEVIRPGAFAKCLASKPDVRCLFNHDANLVLGRTTAGTLRLSEDSVGLKFECDLPDTQVANDLYNSIKRGDINQNSFGFYCIADNWLPIKQAPFNMREVLEAEVFDVSPVTFPAYEATSLSARSLFPDGMEHVEARRAAASAEQGTASRRALAESLLAEIAEEDRVRAEAEQAAVDEQLRTRLMFLKSL